VAENELVLEHSIEVDVTAAFAWQYRTDIATWHDPPATFRLDGSFADGTRGTTVFPGQEPRSWWIRDVRPGSTFSIEMPLDQATLQSEWYFVALAERRTKITQRITLSGPNAAAYREQVEAAFGATLAAGMHKIAADIVAAERTTSSAR
jgi:hypothetical protein